MCYCDIPQDLWLKLEPILPTEGSPRGGRPAGDIGNFFNVVTLAASNRRFMASLVKCIWAVETVCFRFRRWQKRGGLKAILELLTLQADMKLTIIEGSYVRAHKHGTGGRHSSGAHQAVGRNRGGFTSRIHAVVDDLGNLIAFIITGGQMSECAQHAEIIL